MVRYIWGLTDCHPSSRFWFSCGLCLIPEPFVVESECYLDIDFYWTTSCRTWRWQQSWKAWQVGFGHISAFVHFTQKSQGCEMGKTSILSRWHGNWCERRVGKPKLTCAGDQRCTFKRKLLFSYVILFCLWFIKWFIWIPNNISPSTTSNGADIYAHPLKQTGAVKCVFIGCSFYYIWLVYMFTFLDLHLISSLLSFIRLIISKIIV